MVVVELELGLNVRWWLSATEKRFCVNLGFCPAGPADLTSICRDEYSLSTEKRSNQIKENDARCLDIESRDRTQSRVSF
jgi:hypothetical protein